MKTLFITAGFLLLLLLLWILALRCRKGHPLWTTLEQYRYAHRGLHNKAAGVPENSLAAFRLAVEHGFGVELDIHLTKDRRLAVIHDTSLLRTTGADVNVPDLTAEELKQYRLEGTDEQVPLLEEVLPLFEGKTPLIVELKVDGNAAELTKAACALLDQYSVTYCIESFHPQPIGWLRKHRPDICRGQLSENFLSTQSTLSVSTRFIMTHLLTSFLTVPDFIAYAYRHRNLPALKLSKAIWGAREISWTIRDESTMKALEKEGCIPIFEGFVPQ